MSVGKVRTFIPSFHADIVKLITECNIKLNPLDLIYQDDGGKEFAERLKKALLVGRFEISGGFQTEPPELSKLDPETEIILRENDIDSLATASSALFYIQEIVNRQKKQRYLFNEIALILALESGGSISYIREQQEKAFNDGRLVFLCNGSPVDPTTYTHPMGAHGFWDEYSTPERINRWLEQWGAEYRFPSKSEVPNEKPKQKQSLQEDAIIQWLKSSGRDPLALPKNNQGKRGIKADCRDYFLTNRLDLFTNNSFEGAWKRLRNEQRIIDSRS